MGSLTILLLLPFVALVVILLLPSGKAGLLRSIALGATLLQAAWFFASILPQFQAGAANFMDFRLVEQLQWIRLDLGQTGLLNIEFHLAMDGISLVLTMLTVIVLPIVAYKSFEVEK